MTDEGEVANCWRVLLWKGPMLATIGIAVMGQLFGGTSWIDDHPRQRETVHLQCSSACLRSQAISKWCLQKQLSMISCSISLEIYYDRMSIASVFRTDEKHTISDGRFF